MIDQKFSYESFVSKGLGSDKARQLADDLQVEVTREFHEVIKKKMAEIVQSLNEKGHNLEIFEEEEDCISYCDYRSNEEQNNKDVRRLRLAVDIVISSGFGD